MANTIFEQHVSETLDERIGVGVGLPVNEGQDSLLKRLAIIELLQDFLGLFVRSE